MFDTGPGVINGYICKPSTIDLGLPMKKAKLSRPTREEILKGIRYKPLVMGKGVPEYVRAAEDRGVQDYIVAWTQGLWDHINKFAAAADDQPAERGRAKTSPMRP